MCVAYPTSLSGTSPHSSGIWVPSPKVGPSSPSPSRLSLQLPLLWAAQFFPSPRLKLHVVFTSSSSARPSPNIKSVLHNLPLPWPPGSVLLGPCSHSETWPGVVGVARPCLGILLRLTHQSPRLTNWKSRSKNSLSASRNLSGSWFFQYIIVVENSKVRDPRPTFSDSNWPLNLPLLSPESMLQPKVSPLAFSALLGFLSSVITLLPSKQSSPV